MNRAWETVRGGAARVFRSVWQTQDHAELVRTLVAKLEPPRGRMPILVETGCGVSTFALAEAARELGGMVYSCDLDAAKAEALCAELGDLREHVEFLIGDSLANLARIAERHERIEFALFDSAPSATHTLREFLALEPRFCAGSRVLVDDAALPGARLLLSPCRKGKLVVPYLLASPFWAVRAHPRAGDSMVSALLDTVGARADRSYEDPRYVDDWRASLERKLRPLAAT